MKLRWSPTSPYVRKVAMVLIECGLDSAVEKQVTNAWAPDTDLPADNPLGKVPALILDDGSALYDSPVIAEYLDTLHDGPRLFPASGPARWTALRQQALADGICDAAILRRLELQRPDGERSESWADRQRRAVARALDVLEAEAPALDGTLTIGTLSILVALGYLDFRFGHEHWRVGRPELAAWFASASDLDSFRRTAPPPA
ncbi:glutathione S-transferase N-terminal domain-containing protein [Azospirillum brasilense]|uniref:glutathione S-transferase N-terminal domain-containing protein n=1 Tax=Azospirillum brasilense TaxID=192 RepID=UPI001EDC213F|nr:glutathione S-transferase N-terminal domain-containing protein [Azospirillum brasilense]UKJ74613.1 glutathione S-transferase N-terminal domain-containing protein [Azospirillum brasilense]